MIVCFDLLLYNHLKLKKKSCYWIDAWFHKKKKSNFIVWENWKGDDQIWNKEKMGGLFSKLFWVSASLPHYAFGVFSKLFFL